jgi:hypothetical protein
LLSEAGPQGRLLAAKIMEALRRIACGEYAPYSPHEVRREQSPASAARKAMDAMA